MNTAAENPQSPFHQAVHAIISARKVCILTGAGISAESGIPTFRDKQTGLWENYRAEDLANINAFHRDPQLVWSWYQWRRTLVQDKKPNPAHHALFEWVQKTPSTQSGQTQEVVLITQNVDDLHEQAGSTAAHLHGHLWKNRCADCHKPYEAPIDYQSDALLICEHCGGYVRPDIVWFGEMLPQQAWQHAELAASECDVFISIGTSSIVYPAAGLAGLAKSHGATIIEVNPNPTNAPVVDIQLEGKAGDILPALVAALNDNLT